MLHSAFGRQFQKIGSCSICMRSALLYAVSVWLLWMAMVLVSAPSVVLSATLVAASTLSAIWVMHVVVYVMKSIKFMAHRSERAEQNVTHIRDFGRRNVLKTIARASAVASLASLPTVLLSKQALAFCGQCTVDADCGSSDSNWCCKNTAPVNAGYVCNECKKCV